MTTERDFHRCKSFLAFAVSKGFRVIPTEGEFRLFADPSIYPFIEYEDKDDETASFETVEEAIAFIKGWDYFGTHLLLAKKHQGGKDVKKDGAGES